MKPRSFIPATLIASDLLAFNISPLLAGFFLYFITTDLYRYIPQAEINSRLLCYFLLSLLTTGWYGFKLKHYGERLPFWFELKEILRTIVIFSIIDLAIIAFSKWEFSRYLWLTTWILILILVPTFRIAIKFAWQKANHYRVQAVILGGGENALEAYEALEREKYLGYEFIALLTIPGEKSPLADKLPLLAEESELKKLHNYRKLQYFIATDIDQDKTREHWIKYLTSNHCHSISIIPTTRGVPLNNIKMSFLFSEEILILNLNASLTRLSSRILKRIFDITVSLILLSLLSPIFLFLSFFIIRDGGAPMYGHERVGRGGKKFKCWKFRSMLKNSQEILENILATDPSARAEWEKDFKLKNDPRITPLGHFIRRTSIDELPQLFNVLLGQMSLVGPRPVVQEELLRYGENADYYLLAKPGMTGLWQVSGRNDVDYDKRVYFDAWYVKNWSLWNDLAILFKTVNVVLNRRGAY